MVRNYWVGGPLLDKVDPDELLTRLRSAFTGQVTGMLDDICAGNALAHHSFHVFVVYPWVRFLDRDPTTPLQVMQDCRIRWGTVESVDDDHAVITSAPLTFATARLSLATPRAERVRWRKERRVAGARRRRRAASSPHTGTGCAAPSRDAECDALAEATNQTLDLVNDEREAELVSASGAVSRTGTRVLNVHGRRSPCGGREE